MKIVEYHGLNDEMIAAIIETAYSGVDGGIHSPRLHNDRNSMHFNMRETEFLLPVDPENWHLVERMREVLRFGNERVEADMFEESYAAALEGREMADEEVYDAAITRRLRETWDEAQFKGWVSVRNIKWHRWQDWHIENGLDWDGEAPEYPGYEAVYTAWQAVVAATEARVKAWDAVRTADAHDTSFDAAYLAARATEQAVREAFRVAAGDVPPPRSSRSSSASGLPQPSRCG